jgi:hypothetical protein
MDVLAVIRELKLYCDGWMDGWMDGILQYGGVVLQKAMQDARWIVLGATLVCGPQHQTSPRRFQGVNLNISEYSRLSACSQPPS